MAYETYMDRVSFGPTKIDTSVEIQPSFLQMIADLISKVVCAIFARNATPTVATQVETPKEVETPTEAPTVKPLAEKISKKPFEFEEITVKAEDIMKQSYLISQDFYRECYVIAMLS